jgi:hypothetical protein
MVNEQEALALARISKDLEELFYRRMGKPPDPEALKAEAEELVARHGPSFSLEDMIA